MFRQAMVALSAVGLPLSALASTGSGSFYPVKPDEPNAVVLDRSGFPDLHADGATDDSAALQRAVNEASKKSLLLLIPEARYCLARTVGIPPSTRVIGFGRNRPTFVLAAHTPGYDQDAPKYMVWFSGGSRTGSQPIAPHDGSVGAGFSDANPGTFYSGLSNIDFEIQEGNPAAVAIRAHFAQHGIVTHAEFHIGGGYAAMDQIGNEAEDLRFVGGDYGIVSAGTSPSWQYTLLDSSFEGQRISAIKSRNTGLVLVRNQFSNLPTVVSIDENQNERLWMKDCRLDNISGPAIIIGSQDNVRMQVNLQDVVCRKTPVLAAYLNSKRQVTCADEMYRVKTFTYGLTVGDDQPESEITERFESTPLSDIPAEVPSDILPLPPMDSWANLRSFGAVGDGVTDDTAAFNSAIAKSTAVFIPAGRYRVSDTIHLNPTTVLIGLNPITTQIAIDDAAGQFTGPGQYKAIIDAPPNGMNILQGLAIDTGANNPRAVGVTWRAGRNSMINDVKFLGGHGTLLPGGHHLWPYNHDHTGDPNPARRWNSCGPSLWITDNGGGTFANIWTASTFASAGMVVEHTNTPGRIYELSSEHHVNNEIIFRRVSNWEIYAQQTEEEWGESPACLPLLIDSCSHLTFANTILFRVFAMAAPYPAGISISNSRDLLFFGIKTYGQSPFNFDQSVLDTSTDFRVPEREIALVRITGAAPQRHGDRPTATSGMTLEKVADGFYSADHAVTDTSGNAYFVDLHQNKIFQYSPLTRQVTVLRDDPVKPFALAVDRAQNLIILSRLGKAFGVSLKDPHRALTELTPVTAAPRPGMIAIVPADRWWDGGQFLETNARREPLDILSPDGSIYIPIPVDFHTGEQHNWTGQPIDLYRGFQLTAAKAGQQVYVADETEHKTWSFTATDQGTLINPRLFAQRGEAGVTTDRAGNVYIAEGDIYVYNSQGKSIARIQVPDRPLSLVFCGQDAQTLLITTRHSAYTIPVTAIVRDNR